MDLDRINRAWYSQPSAVRSYSADDLLEPALSVILVRLRDHFVDRPVLDIGVGAGRTSLYLTGFTIEYVGIDYSPAMVAHCRGRFPGERFEVCDVRDLGRFADGSFSFVLFSYNGIGAIDHDGRMRALGEVARVLQPGGAFAFSAHNRNYADLGHGPRLALSRNPFTQAHNVVYWVRQVRNRARVRRFESAGPEYALVNDPAEQFSLLHYYIAKEEQRRQLARVGLELVEMYDRGANRLSDGSADRHTPWIWYVARRT